MKDLKGTKTEKNLETAFAGESMARNKYSFYASKAKKDGFEQIAALFEETAQNEKEHAKMWFKYLHGGNIGTTSENLEDAAAEGIGFSRDGDRIWKCRNCGHIVIGPKAPQVCPTCNHPQSYFEINAENY